MSAPDEQRSLDDGFTWWPVAELRSAGFPVSRLAPLGSARVVDAARAVVVAEAEVAAARRAALAAVAEARRARDDQRAVWNGHARAIERGHARAATGDTVVDACWAALVDARRGRDDARRAFDDVFARARDDAHAALHAALDDERLRRAVLWQNRRAAKGTLDAARAPDAKARARARAELLLTAYLARYTTKNDTVGFFGPVGWVALDRASSTELAVTARAPLIAAEAVHFEPWAIAALADAVTPDVLPHLVPALSPRVRREGDVLLGAPSRRLDLTRPLTVRERAVLDRVDGRAALKDLALDDDHRAVLDDLVARGLVRVRLPVTADGAPEATLVRALAALPDDDGVRRARARVASVVDHKRALERAKGDARALEERLDALAAAFSDVTGRDAERNPGQTYGSRTLAYLNARRDVDVTLGGPLLARLDRPLALLLQAARWFTCDVARRFTDVVTAIHHDLARRTRRTRVPLHLVYARLVPVFQSPPAAFIAEARAELGRRLEALLPCPPDATEVRFSSSALAGPFADAFAATGPGYPGARHHSPDLLLARRADGTLVPVIGEIHVGTNTLAVLQAVDQSTNPDALRARFREDLTPPLVVEIQHEDYALCAHDSLLDARDLHLDTGSRFTSWLPAARTIPVSALDLGPDDDGALVVTDVSGARVGPLLAVLERMVRLNATTEFHLPVRAPHQPRVWIDDVVVTRASWHLDGDALGPLCDEDRARRVLAWSALAEARGLPRHLFLRVPTEKKPLYVDRGSPVIVDAIARVLKDAPRAVLAEMLPSPDETWLTDVERDGYVAEIRLVATDARAGAARAEAR